MLRNVTTSYARCYTSYEMWNSIFREVNMYIILKSSYNTNTKKFQSDVVSAVARKTGEDTLLYTNSISHYLSDENKVVWNYLTDTYDIYRVLGDRDNIEDVSRKQQKVIRNYLLRNTV